MKKVLLYIVIGVTLLAIPATVFLVGKNQELRKRAAPASQLSLVPANITKKVGDTFTLEAQIDTADNQVTTAQIHITYDPTKLQAVSITNGALAPRIVASGSVEQGSGKASITVGATSNTAPIKGTGTIATLTMKAIAASATPVSVNFTSLPDTYAAGLSEGSNNVLVGIVGTHVTILNADGTPAKADAGGSTVNTAATPSPSVTAAPTPTATTTPSAQFPSSSSATGSASASSSAQLQMLSPAANESVPTSTPTFHGVAPPGSTVTLTIHSTQQTVVVATDANGNWSYTPTSPLDPGPHTVVALATNPTTGATQTTTTSFVVAGAAAGGGTSSQSAIPATGSVETTIALLVGGIVLFLSGALLPMFVQ